MSLLSTGLFGLSAKLEAGRILATIGKADTLQLMDVSVQEWLDLNVSHKEVQELILAVFRLSTYTNAPELMSAGTAIEQLKMAQDTSVLYLDGGWQTLVDGLRDMAIESGVMVATEARVEGVIRDSAGTVEGVRLSNGEARNASTVVIAASPPVAVALVDGGGRTSISTWADTAIPVKAACLDVALSRLPVPKATFALGIDRPVYLSVHSAAARLAPPGAARVEVAKYLEPGRDERPASLEGELEALLDLIQPGWRDVVVYRRLLPDMVVMNAMPLALNNGTHGRPGPQVADVPGLYVVGDWVGKEGLLVDASLASAKQAAGMIVENESDRAVGFAGW
jgi:phytoene dehydrogenase-like protein